MESGSPARRLTDSSLPETSRAHIIGEARANSPSLRRTRHAAQNRTGLVVGNVQSGKTTSFTTVAALARDNGYRMVIVIAGTSENLFFQNRNGSSSASTPMPAQEQSVAARLASRSYARKLTSPHSRHR